MELFSVPLMVRLERDARERREKHDRLIAEVRSILAGPQLPEQSATGLSDQQCNVLVGIAGIIHHNPKVRWVNKLHLAAIRNGDTNAQRASFSRCLRRLVERGLIVSHAIEGTANHRHIYLTAEGASLVRSRLSSVNLPNLTVRRIKPTISGERLAAILIAAYDKADEKYVIDQTAKDEAALALQKHMNTVAH